jgi:hypothetical protein
MADPSLEGLIGLLNIRKKRLVERYARGMTVTSEAFANLILAGRVGALLPQYQYQAHFDEKSPSHLEPTREELNALGRNGVGELKGQALKGSRRSVRFSETESCSAFICFIPRLINFGISSILTNGIRIGVGIIGGKVPTFTIPAIS